jgi:hypothetical protein
MSSNFILDQDLAKDLTQISQSVPGFNMGEFVNDAIRAAIAVQKTKIDAAEAKAKEKWMQGMKKKGLSDNLSFDGGRVKFQ